MTIHIAMSTDQVRPIKSSILISIINIFVQRPLISLLVNLDANAELLFLEPEKD